jgi:hypothetical protein
MKRRNSAVKVIRFFRLWGTDNQQPNVGSQKNYHISRPLRRTVIFSLEILEKNNDEYISVLVIYWKKSGLLHTKISNHNTIYSPYKPRKLSSLPLKSSSWLFSLDASTGIYKFGNNTYPRRIRRRSNLGYIFQGKKVHLMGQEIRYINANNYTNKSGNMML